VLWILTADANSSHAFEVEDALDHAGRKIENENTFLLDLIDQYRPQRIVNLHAIRDTSYAGVLLIREPMKRVSR
jgi:hypothetical protein